MEGKLKGNKELDEREREEVKAVTPDVDYDLMESVIDSAGNTAYFNSDTAEFYDEIPADFDTLQLACESVLGLLGFTVITIEELEVVVEFTLPRVAVQSSFKTSARKAEKEQSAYNEAEKL